MIISIILPMLLSIIISMLPEEGIDFNPRLLQKELSNVVSNKTYQMIELPLSDSRDLKMTGKFFKVSSQENIIVYIGRVNSCRSGGCSNQLDSQQDFQSEFFDYFIIFDSRKVKVVRVFNYAATHGQEVIIKKWLEQFSGYDGSKPLRAGKEVDTISGATISVNALIADIKEKTSLIN